MRGSHTADGVEYAFRAAVPEEDTITLLEAARRLVFADGFPSAAGIPIVEVVRSRRHVRGWVYSTGRPSDGRIHMSVCLPKIHSQQTRREYDIRRGRPVCVRGIVKRDPVDVAERLLAVCCHEWGHVREAWEMFGSEMLSHHARKQWYDRKTAYRHIACDNRPWEIYAREIERQALDRMFRDPETRLLVRTLAIALATST